MNNIFEKQNSEKFIKLLAAQRHMYNKAKKIKSNRTNFSLFLLITSLLLPFWYSKGVPYLGVISGIWTIALLLFKNYEKKVIIQGAKIQEEFDTTLFELPWNSFLVGSKITREVIADANSSFKGDRSRLQNWYANYNNDAHIKNVLQCQRANLSWDWRLRQAYCNFLLIMVCILFFGEAIYALVQQKSLIGYLNELLIPSIPILLIGIESIIEHKALAQEKQSNEQQVSSLLEANNLDMETIRKFQDLIYSFRTSTALIPDYFYKRLWRRYDRNMHNSVE
ncbi:S-4TM family putative pore-forming effector [Neobacillus drentensis]|uniref:S-4TM family putative pore-forming effector n=1 Tax=Neobacillus drentensis TaxID=220684 RepID=UPI003001B4D8